MRVGVERPISRQHFDRLPVSIQPEWRRKSVGERLMIRLKMREK
jgi:N-acetylglutamate synthase-like GNAT family acetyltransferase